MKWEGTYAIVAAYRAEAKELLLKEGENFVDEKSGFTLGEALRQADMFSPDPNLAPQ